MSFENIHNYYEKRVIDYVKRTLSKRISDEEYLADVACVALNKLPPRYIRYEVDMMFFLTSNEQQKIDQEIAQAVQNAIKILDQRNSDPSAPAPGKSK